MRQYYQKVRLWSVVHGGYIVRISMCDDRGGEFFITLPDNRGAKWLRGKIHGQEIGGEYFPGALDMLAMAIDKNEEPGERKLKGVY